MGEGLRGKGGGGVSGVGWGGGGGLSFDSFIDGGDKGVTRGGRGRLDMEYKENTSNSPNLANHPEWNPRTEPCYCAQIARKHGRLSIYSRTPLRNYFNRRGGGGRGGGEKTLGPL